MFTIIASRTGDVLYVTDSEEDVERELRALHEEEGIPSHLL